MTDISQIYDKGWIVCPNIVQPPIGKEHQFQVADVVIDALRSLGIPIGNVNNENLEDEGFWHQTHLSLENGRRHGTYRERIQLSLILLFLIL